MYKFTYKIENSNFNLLKYLRSNNYHNNIQLVYNFEPNVLNVFYFRIKHSNI